MSTNTYFTRYVTVRISGAKDSWKQNDIKELLGFRHVYRKGTDPSMYVDMSREDANLLIASLNSTPGVKAEILNY
jgi:hypothetical protein